MPNHVASGDSAAEAVAGRAMVCERLEMLPGGVRGARLPRPVRAWRTYLATRSICGVRPAAGPQGRVAAAEADVHARHQGRAGRARRERHFDEVIVMIGQEEAQELKRMTLDDLRRSPARSPAERGLILADTKFEFGFAASGKNAGAIVLADEVLTPDSSRYWPPRPWQPGGAAAVLRQAVRARLADLARVAAGTVTPTRRRRRCPTTSSSRRARSTSRHTSGSPARRSHDDLAGHRWRRLHRRATWCGRCVASGRDVVVFDDFSHGLRQRVRARACRWCGPRAGPQAVSRAPCVTSASTASSIWPR